MINEIYIDETLFVGFTWCETIWEFSQTQEDYDEWFLGNLDSEEKKEFTTKEVDGTFCVLIEEHPEHLTDESLLQFFNEWKDSVLPSIN